MKLYIVWNIEAQEGLVFSSYEDARCTLEGAGRVPTIGWDYLETYPDNNTIVTINADDMP